MTEDAPPLLAVLCPWPDCVAAELWCRMVTTHGAGSGGRLWERDNRSWAASVSSMLRSLKMSDECGGSPPEGPVRREAGETTTSFVATELWAKYLMLCAEAEGLNLMISRFDPQEDGEEEEDVVVLLSLAVLFGTAAPLMKLPWLWPLEP